MHRLSRRGHFVHLVSVVTLLLMLCVAISGRAFGPVTAYAADDIEVSISKFEDCTMLPGWDNFVEQEGQYFEFNHSTGESHPGNYTAFSAQVVSEQPKNAGDVVIELEEVSDGWVVHARNYGEATIKVTYRRDNADSEESYTTNVTVASDAYTIDMWFEGSESALPGGTIRFGANGRREYIDDNGEYGGTDEGLVFRWRLDEETAGGATLQWDESNPTEASVTFPSSLGDEDMVGVMVIVELLDEDGNVVASDDRWATAMNEYCELYPYMIDRPQFGEEFTLTPQVRLYTKDEDGYRDITGECTFELSFDESNAQLLGESDGVYRFKRIGMNPITITVVTRDEDQHEIANRDYWLPSPNYDAWFGEDGRVFVKTDDAGNRSGSTTLTLKTNDDLANLPGCVVEWTIGEANESGFTKIYKQFTSSEFTCNIDGAELLDAGAQGGVNVRACVMANDGETQVAWDGCWVEIREEEYRYDLEGDFDTITGRVFDVITNRLAFVVDEQHPQGEDIPFTITGVRIKSQKPDKGVKKVIELKEQSGGKGWEYRAIGHGKATIELTYKDVYGAEQKHEFTVTVTNELFRVFINSADGRTRAFPGDSIAVIAEGMHFVEGVDGVSSDGMTYAWELSEESKQYASITVDKKDPSRATVKFKKLPAGQDRIWQDVEVMVRMSYEGKERAQNHTFLTVATTFTDLWPTTLDVNFPVNTEMNVRPELRVYDTEIDGGYAVIPNVSFTWDYDENVLQITDNKDGSYTLKRLSEEHGCDYQLIATWVDRRGNQSRESKWYWFLAKASTPTTQEMHRLYNPNSGEHFYTASTVERDKLVEYGWRYEGVGWIAPEKSNTPVYRLYNANAGDHHYTTSEKERDALVSRGWKYEAIGWYSDDAKGTPLYRQYNPNAISGSHNYTTNEKENDALVKLGWKAEGIGWYGVKQ